MNPLARRTVAAVTAGALAVGSVPMTAFAQNAAPAAPAVSAPAPVSPAAALQRLQQWGVFRGEGDVLRTYIGDASHLTPLGQALYQTLSKAHDPRHEKRALIEEVEGLQPAFDRLRQNGPYDERRAKNVDKTLKIFEKQFGKLAEDPDGSLEDEVQRGALREALMTGAAAAEAPKQGEMTQVRVAGGVEFWDKNGLAYRINSLNATTYNRQLQQNQRLMNQSRPPDVPFIPETGRYNLEMFRYSLSRMRSQHRALVDGLHRDRMVAMAELLGKAGEIREDSWFNDKRIEADLETQARAKIYNHLGKDYSVLELVDARLAQRQYYLDEAEKYVERYRETVTDAVRGMKVPVIGDDQIQKLSKVEQSSLRMLNLGVVETLKAYVKNLIERIDPASPEAEQVLKAIDKSDLSAQEKAAYKDKAREMVGRLRSLYGVLERIRRMLSASDYEEHMDVANAMLTSAQRELNMIIGDYSMYVEIPTIGALAKDQLDVTWFNFVGKGFRRAYLGLRPFSEYTRAINAMKAGQGKYAEIERLIAAGRMAEARQAVIAMNPGAMRESLSAALGADAGRASDEARRAASLKVNRDRLNVVFETNKWLDSTGNMFSWIAEVALAAPLLKGGANLGVRALTPAEGEMALTRSPNFFIRRGSIAAQEIFRHTAAQFENLERDRMWVTEKTAGLSNPYARWSAETMLSTARRAGMIGYNQALFTGMSAGISGGYMTVSHYWDKLSQKALGPGETLNVPFTSKVLIRPSNSMFDSGWEAFKTGAKGGYWWANTNMEVGGHAILHPGWLGYVGLPSTVFKDSSLAPYADLVAGRGVVGAAVTGGKWQLQDLAAWTGRKLTAAGKEELGAGLSRWGARAMVGEEAVQYGFLDRLARQDAVGKYAGLRNFGGKYGSFVLSLGDNVVKYSLFSDAVSRVGKYATYRTFDVPADMRAPLPGLSEGEQDRWAAERHIRASEASYQKWMASPAWMLIPTFSGDLIRDSAIYRHSEAGAAQYDAAGRTKEYAGLKIGDKVPFIDPPRASILDRMFGRSADTGREWTVTTEISRRGTRRVVTEALGGADAAPKNIHPLRLYEATQMHDGEKFAGIVEINKESRLILNELLAESLRDDPARAAKAFAADLKPGSVVPELGGRITPGVQRDLAVALHTSEALTGKPMPRELAARVEEIVKPYAQARAQAAEGGAAFARALEAAPVKAPGLDAALQADVAEAAARWRTIPEASRPSVDAFLAELKGRVDARKAGGTLSAQEAAVLEGLHRMLVGEQAHFNAFNNVERVRSQAGETLESLKTQYQGDANVAALVERMEGHLKTWSEKHPSGKPVDGPASDGVFKGQVLPELAAELKGAKSRLTAEQFQDAERAFKDIQASPWAIRDGKGDPLPGWRPDQFVSLLEGLSAVAKETRSSDGAMHVFQKLGTGGGKTPMSFVGLLPLLEAVAERRGRKLIFLTVQPNLEAQGRNDFLAYKIVGSKLSFDTYENFKAKIAEGKTKGVDVLSQYVILGDEMDGAALQAALTLGNYAGALSKRSPLYNRIEEVDKGLEDRLQSGRVERGARVQTEAKRAGYASSRLRGEGPAAEARAESARLELAADRLLKARDGAARRGIEKEIAASAGRLETLLERVPVRDQGAVADARKAIDALRKSLTAAPADAKARAALVQALEEGITGEQNVLRIVTGEEGLTRLAETASADALQLQETVRALSAKGDSEALAVARRELAIAELFRAEDAGHRLAVLQEKIVGAKPGEPRLDGWKADAARLQSGLPEEGRALAEAHAQARREILETGAQYTQLQEQIVEAAREGRPVEPLKLQQETLKRDFDAKRAEAERLKDALSSGALAGDLGGMMRRLEVLRAEAQALEGRLQSAKALGQDASPEAARLAEVRAERADLLKRTLAEVRTRFGTAADEVIARAKAGGGDWEDASVSLLSRRRRLLEAFAGNENPMYGTFGEMKDAMEAFWLSESLKSQDPSVYKPAQEKMMRAVNGPSLWKSLPSVVKMTLEVWRGEPVTVPVEDVGLTRIFSAKLLRSLASDPTLSAHERDSLFWSFTSSLLWPGSGENNSWVRKELLSMLQGFRERAERPGDIRYDSRTGKVISVHNGNWVELDKPTVRFWQQEFGADMTMPLTESGLSTIKDVTTDKGAMVFGFSATEGEFGKHLHENGFTVSGKGSPPPGKIGVDILPNASETLQEVGRALDLANASRGLVQVDPAVLEEAPAPVKDAVVRKAGGPLTGPRLLPLSEFSGEARSWLDGLRQTQGDADRVVLRRSDAVPSEAKPAIDAFLAKEGLMGKGVDEAVVRIGDVQGVDTRQTEAARKWLRELRASQADDVTLLRTDAVPAEFKPAIDAYLKERGASGRDAVNVRVRDVVARDKNGTRDEAKTEAAQKWLRELRPGHLDSALVTVLVPDTRSVRQLREYLKRAKGLRDEEIAMVFSDTEYLRNNVPEARVDEQMNLKALNTGRARVLILDARVGGRGLDLNYKGERGSMAPRAFRGYTNHEASLQDMQLSSGNEQEQGMGRLSPGRVMPGSAPEFTIALNLRALADEPVFRDMVAKDTFFTQDLGSDPRFVEFAQGRKPDLALYHRYVESRAADGSETGRLLAEKYEEKIKEYLAVQQAKVERDHLRSASVFEGVEKIPVRFPGVEGMR